MCNVWSVNKTSKKFVSKTILKHMIDCQICTKYCFLLGKSLKTVLKPSIQTYVHPQIRSKWQEHNKVRLTTSFYTQISFKTWNVVLQTTKLSDRYRTLLLKDYARRVDSSLFCPSPNSNVIARTGFLSSFAGAVLSTNHLYFYTCNVRYFRIQAYIKRKQRARLYQKIKQRDSKN